MAHKAAHTQRLGTYNMYESTGVQSLEHTADLIKVGGVTRNMSLEKSPSMVGGRVERFCEIGNMIC